MFLSLREKWDRNEKNEDKNIIYMTGNRKKRVDETRITLNFVNIMQLQ